MDKLLLLYGIIKGEILLSRDSVKIKTNPGGIPASRYTSNLVTLTDKVEDIILGYL